VTNDCEIRLALPAEASAIAAMSRDLIERGLDWRWDARRVAHSIRDRASNTAVAHVRGRLCGFGIMKYRENEAHLLLLAVHPTYQGQGVGSALVGWLEDCALTAGIGVIYLEARSGNAAARAFYRRLGYKEFALASGYYQRTEDAVRLAKDLWQDRGEAIG
jgi:[ribosomal protein S18]-alanine N-acetyltransferase